MNPKSEIKTPDSTAPPTREMPPPASMAAPIRLDTETLETLRNSKLFKGIDLPQFAKVVAMGQVHKLGFGDRVIEPGEPNRRIFVVLEGQLGVFLDHAMQNNVARLAPGQVVGEHAILSDESGSVYVAAQWPALVMSFEANAFREFMAGAPVIALNLIELLSERLRASNQWRLKTDMGEAHAEFQATHDPLTGLHNRRWMQEAFEREINRHRIDGTPIALLSVDVDHLQKINESAGRSAADNVLKHVADTIKQVLRPSDIAARESGDRFAVLLPGASMSAAVQVAERLRKAVNQRQVHLGGRMATSTSVSIGCAEDATLALDALGELAHERMEQAKAQGRNRVEPAPSHLH